MPPEAPEPANTEPEKNQDSAPAKKEKEVEPKKPSRIMSFIKDRILILMGRKKPEKKKPKSNQPYQPPPEITAKYGEGLLENEVKDLEAYKQSVEGQPLNETAYAPLYAVRDTARESVRQIVGANIIFITPLGLNEFLRATSNALASETLQRVRRAVICLEHLEHRQEIVSAGLQSTVQKLRETFLDLIAVRKNKEGGYDQPDLERSQVIYIRFLQYWRMWKRMRLLFKLKKAKRLSKQLIAGLSSNNMIGTESPDHNKLRYFSYSVFGSGLVTAGQTIKEKINRLDKDHPFPGTPEYKKKQQQDKLKRSRRQRQEQGGLAVAV